MDTIVSDPDTTEPGDQNPSPGRTKLFTIKRKKEKMHVKELLIGLEASPGA